MDQYLSNCGSTYHEIQRQTKIIYDPCDVTRESNRFNIAFIPIGASDEETMHAMMFVSNLLTKELNLRKLPLHGNLEARRNRLLQKLKVEKLLQMITLAVSRGQEGKEAALILIEQALPCIMHMENRVGEKLITVILSMGAERY